MALNGKKANAPQEKPDAVNYKEQCWLSLYCGIRNYLKLVKSSASNWLGVNIEATGTTLYKMHYQKIAIKSTLLFVSRQLQERKKSRLNS